MRFAYAKPAPAKGDGRQVQVLEMSGDDVRSSLAALRIIALSLVVVTGYADKSGNAAANLELAKKRALAVRDELVKLGVDARRIQVAPPAAGGASLLVVVFMVLSSSENSALPTPKYEGSVN